MVGYSVCHLRHLCQSLQHKFIIRWPLFIQEMRLLQKNGNLYMMSTNIVNCIKYYELEASMNK